MVAVLILLSVATRAVRGAISSACNNMRDSNIPTRVPHRVRVRGPSSSGNWRQNNVTATRVNVWLLQLHCAKSRTAFLATQMKIARVKLNQK